ncbi:hypothetical protein NBRC116188_26080 [Oceaniserpentilla sp. 4NH20-0058]|uniref:SRPBCC family protein n=1 Tax=Oceaniserpentilla sp. 4NH20-0058 TaxID=3127660 RepID=UPI003106D9B2
MSEESFSIDIQIENSPSEVFSALTVNIDRWWTKYSNTGSKNGDTLKVEFEGDTAWVMELQGVQENSKLSWSVISAHHNLSSLRKTDEWKGTNIQWEIDKTESGCIVKLTHNGLIPSLECYEICNNGWQYFLGSLKQFLETGEGYPFG